MISLILGGTRSGKSALAEQVAARARDQVTYLATGDPQRDPDFASRVERHRERRPGSWQTVEVSRGGDLVGPLDSCLGTVLVDSLGIWLAGFPEFVIDPAPLVEVLQRRRFTGLTTVIVSDEVGLSVHPSSDAGRRFRDALGDLNRAIADISDEVVLVVAGRGLRLPAEL